MLEIPEAANISREVKSSLVGKRIEKVEAAHTPHKWAWYHGDPSNYPDRLEGRTIDDSTFWGGLIDYIMIKNLGLCP